jgi:hypothetical protein
VSSEDTLLSHIKGTSLSIFGTKLDITDFVEEKGVDYDSSELSYSHILRVIFREDQDVEHVPYPDYNTLHSYAAWYILSLNPYTMLLDKPTFMKLVSVTLYLVRHAPLTTLVRFGGSETILHSSHHPLRQSACI